MRTYTYRLVVFVTLQILLVLIILPIQTHAADCVEGALCNPLSTRSIEEFIVKVLQAIVMIALPILTLFIVYSGFLFISARGNSSKLEDAKRNFAYVIIGAVLILGAWILASLIAGTVSQVTG